VFPNASKLTVKIVHAVLLAASLICASVGLKAVFDSHNLANPPKVNLYSMHSWIGLSAVILFGLQWVCGFIAFLLPKLSEEVRGLYMPRYAGKQRSTRTLHSSL
jgi:cytochrome b-561